MFRFSTLSYCRYKVLVKQDYQSLAVPTKTNSVAVDVQGKSSLKSTRSNESNGGSPGTGGGGDNNNGGGGCIGDGCYPPTVSSTTSTTTTTRKTNPPSNNIERTMANELEWCGYLGLRFR